MAREPVAPVFKSSEVVDESSDESMLDAEAETGSERSSSEGASSEAESGTGSTASSDSDSQSESDERQSGAGDVAVAGVKKRKRPAPSPPESFNPCRVSLSSSILDPAQLKGKQLWHISVPAEFDVTRLHEITFPTTEFATVSFGKEKYTATLADASSHNALLTPAANENAYTASQNLIVKSLSFLPSLPLPETNAEASPTNFIKPARKQPPNLKMRYVPFGAAKSDEQLDMERKLQALRDMSVRDIEQDVDTDMADSPNSKSAAKKLKNKVVDRKEHTHFDAVDVSSKQHTNKHHLTAIDSSATIPLKENPNIMAPETEKTQKKRKKNETEEEGRARKEKKRKEKQGVAISRSDP